MLIALYMKNQLLLCGLLLLFFACTTPNREKNNLDTPRVTLPNGWSLTPHGAHLELGDLPLNMVLSNDEKFAFISNNGQSGHSLQWIDLEQKRVLQTIEIPKAWYGLALDKAGKTLYAAAGFDNMVRRYVHNGQKWIESDSLVLDQKWPKKASSPAGLVLSKDEQSLFCVTKGDSSLYVLDLASNKIVERHRLSAEAYACILSEDGKALWISLWGGSAIVRYDLQAKKLGQAISTGKHPNEMVFSKDGEKLYVACADDNAVSVLDLKTNQVIETLGTALYADAPTGSTSNSLALSADGRTLAVANADNNCLALFDVSEAGKSRAKGFIPTGWYPSVVRFRGQNIWVCNGKGMTSKANPKGPNPFKREKDEEYIGGLFKGTLSYFVMPDDAELKNLTRLVYQNTPYSKEVEKMAAGEANNPIPRTLDGKSPIKYVFYIIKENRTYDQVFGDIKEGNGDPRLCLFPDSVTPNQHALAREFVLLDNFYVNAEVSADGHNWSTAAYANDYVEKTWPTNYGSRGGTYDYEGSKAIAYPKDGFIWDFCERAGVSFRSYGEFTHLGSTPYKKLIGRVCPIFPGYNLRIQDQYRVQKWKQDFDSLLAINAVPRMNIVRLANDHTMGARKDAPTPTAMVAENDLAVGQFVEYLSNSKIWKESAIFILEDDAQNGPDHVDAHRSIAMVVSPYTKRKHHEKTIYSTAAMLRTMELILGLRPMSQYDAAAPPMYACFTNKPDFTPFKAKANQVSISALNTIDDKWSKMSWAFNLEEIDQAPDREFNEVIWKAVRGRNAKVPAPRRSAFVSPLEEEEEEEEGRD